MSENTRNRLEFEELGLLSHFSGSNLQIDHGVLWLMFEVFGKID